MSAWLDWPMSRSDAVNSTSVRGMVFLGIALWLVGGIVNSEPLRDLASIFLVMGAALYLLLRYRKPDEEL